MNIRFKKISIKAITKNPLIEKLKAKQAETFDKFRSKFSEKIVF